MNSLFKLSRRAEKSVDEIAHYTFSNWSKRQSIKYTTDLLDKIYFISNNPNIGRIRDDIGLDLYSFPFEHHIIFSFKEKNNIVIADILHKNMEPNLVDWIN